MKKIISILLISLTFTACEEVVDLDLETAEPRLVIEAPLSWVKGTDGSFQFIKLSLTAPFYDSEIPPANGATVFVTDLFGNQFNFIEQDDTGLYRNNTFAPVINRIYNLTIVYNNETYTATEQFMPVSPIEYVIQNNDGGFTGNETEIEVYYNDPAGIENYYLFEFSNSDFNTQSVEIYDDEFTDGNEIFAYYSDEDLVAGDELIIRSSGISKRFYEFTNILLQQTGSDAGDPFETQPATVRGNCINQTNPENYALGYFRASEISFIIYTVE